MNKKLERMEWEAVVDSLQILREHLSEGTEKDQKIISVRLTDL